MTPNLIDRGRAPARDLLMVAALLLAILFVAVLAVDTTRPTLTAHQEPLRALVP